MTWLEQWRDLAARIDGLIRAGEFLVSAFKVNSADAHAVVRKSFQPELVAIIAEIEHLGKTYASELPEQASVALKKYVMQGWDKNFNNGAIDIQALAPLASFRSQFEYLIRDTEVEGRSLTELAFEHLRRQLVVDEYIRKKWQGAFNKHEPACERLGAVHLLSHGIWAFKVVAPGGATDLVFGDPVERHAEIMKRTARALVLTEWKLIKSQDEMTRKAQEAREQAAIYSGGVLGDAELKRTRYIVLVCQLDLPSPDDVSDGAVTYRHVLLPTSPKNPSTMARVRRSRQK
ncbi:MAG: hypothetical protein CAF41_003545 [Nitrospira sp. CG24A]|nr:MAG: hypothetical protein CAF41_003545 [Nitrospira sp. CG24A]